MKINIPTPRQFVDLFDSYDIDEPLPFPWRWFWETLVKQLGCGPSAKLWIVDEGGLEASVDVCLYYEEGNYHCNIWLFAESAFSWDWNVTHGGPRRTKFRWDLLPVRKGSVPKGWSPSKWELDFRQIRREFRRTLREIKPEVAHGVWKDPRFETTTLQVHAASRFDLCYHDEFLDRGKVQITYHGAFAPGHPVNVSFLVAVNPKLVGLLREGKAITPKKAKALLR